MRAVIQANLSAAEQMSLANERGEQVDAVAGAGRGADVSDHPVATAATS